jgi:hypothetical protein
MASLPGFITVTDTGTHTQVDLAPVNGVDDLGFYTFKIRAEASIESISYSEFLFSFEVTPLSTNDYDTVLTAGCNNL